MEKKNQNQGHTDPEKIAILGGGPSALAAAFELSDPSQLGRYEITLYQLGWRLGGKCASGRNAAHCERIQEHGLHVFLGSYDNAFDILRRSYDELGRSPGQPFASWTEAIKGIDHVGLMESVEGEWKPWVVELPTMPGTPGDEHSGSIWALMHSLLTWIGDELSHHSRYLELSDRKDTIDEPSVWQRLADEVFPKIEAGLMAAGTTLVGAILTLIGALSNAIEPHDKDHHDGLASMLGHLRKWVLEHLPEKLEDDFRHFIIVFDLILVNAIGALRDGLVLHPEKHLPKVNQLDYRDWLKSHGALDITADSAVVRGLYDLIFAYPDGDVSRPGQVEAGTMFLSLTQTSRYHGSFMYKMMSGTGDVFASPLYEVMKRRGVKFKFFHRVTSLQPSDDGRWIKNVKISRQVNLKGDTYDPLKDIPVGTEGTLPCWPSEPLYGQIREAEQLQKDGINLESRWTPWTDTGGDLELEFGKDYDWLVLGTSLEPLRELCSQMAVQNDRWKTMLEHQETIQTQSVQLWFGPDLHTINPEQPAGIVLGAYDRDGQPIDTWSDISEVLAVETWPVGQVGNESIICGPMKGPQRPPPADDNQFPEQSVQQVTQNLADFIDQNGQTIWPGLFGSEGFKQSDQVDQYLRANIDPSERYVLTLPGTSDYRMRAQDSGYGNLLLTGDWIQNGQNLGSFEASMVSGKLASRALSGKPEQIARISADSPLYSNEPGQPPAGSLPAFVEHPFLQTFPGPAVLANTRMWSFWLPGDMDRLKSLCDQYFSTTSDGAVRYVPITSQVLVSVVDIGHGSFTDAPEMGWSGEQELAFWILMARVERKDGVLVAERLGLFNPLLVLDNSVAVATGRETYGYQKQQGWISVPDSDDWQGSISVDAFATATYGKSTQQQRHPFLELSPVDGASKGKQSTFKGLEEVVGVLHEALNAEFEFTLPSLQLAKQLFDELVHHGMPQVFLKQFRDVADTRSACYQAILETPIKVSNLRGVGLSHPHELVIHQLDSIDVAQVLGIPNEHTVDFMMHMEMDMTLDTGTVIWQA